MKVQSVKLKTSVLFHAPWNPRGEITPESVADLTASIKAQGLLQDIGVWRDETNAYFVIYGNRRFVACREAGMTEIPAKLYDCPLAVAQELTRIENEVRLGVDPLEDAKLLNSMRTLGFTQEELAAHFAVPLATVCRRLKLIDLAPCFRAALQNGHKITTDALERISAFPHDIQDKICKVYKFDKKNDNSSYQWRFSSFSCTINEILHDLDNGANFEKCRACAKRTGAQPDLFGELDEGAALGCCLDGACYKASYNEWLKNRLDEIVDPFATERFRCKYEWDFRPHGATDDKPSKKKPCAYYVVSGDQIKVQYGPSRAKVKADAKRAKEDRVAQKRLQEQVSRRRDKISKQINAWVTSSLKDAVKDYIGEDPWKVVDLMTVFSVYGYYGNYVRGAKHWKKQRNFETWWKCFGRDGNFDCFYRKHISAVSIQRLVGTLSNVKWDKVLSKDDLKFVKSKDFTIY